MPLLDCGSTKQQNSERQTPSWEEGRLQTNPDVAAQLTTVQFCDAVGCGPHAAETEICLSLRSHYLSSRSCSLPHPLLPAAGVMATARVVAAAGRQVMRPLSATVMVRPWRMAMPTLPL